MGRASSLAVTVSSDGGWFEEALLDVKSASHIHLACFAFDQPRMTSELLKRLTEPEKPECLIVVDAAYYDSRKAKYQRPRLRDLQKNGATVRLASGTTSYVGGSKCVGAMHVKALVIDRRIAYVGSGNMTFSAQFNRELMFRMVGPPVTEVLAAIFSARDDENSVDAY